MRYKVLTMAGLAVILAGCAGVGTPQKRGHDAEILAREAGFSRQILPGADFNLTVYSRMGAPGQKARVYIEGDGLAWMGRRMPSTDPTPTDPVALRLAAADDFANVIYIARPCQYSGGARCGRDYWTGKRFAPETVRATDEALSRVVTEGRIAGIELVGFSGGGAMAALLAARRDDVLNLRTVAGNLDHRTHSHIHSVTPLQGSLNPPDFAARLRAVPQRHFTGAQDRNVTAAVYESYARALGDRSCVGHDIVEGAAHETGWVAQWPVLLRADVACR